MSTEIKLKQLLDNFTNKNILIVGDVMVDEYLWGDVKRISPEAPVPVVSCTSREHRMGGAANVAVNIKALGAEPIMCSVVGEDPIGAIYKDLLNKNGMTDEGIISAQNRQTTVKTRVISNHQHLLRVDQEITSFLDKKLEVELIARIKNIISNRKIDALILQDYDKGVLTPEVIKGVSEIARAQQVPTLVDPKKRSFMSYSGISLFKPNFKEFIEGLNLDLSKDDFDGIFEASLKFLHKPNQIDMVMITLSEKGVFVSNGKEYKVLPAEERDIADVSGAGDTVISVTALCLASGVDSFQTAQLANIAGGLVCEKIGVVPITADILLGDKCNSLNGFQ